MKPSVLLINPPVCDFSLYDLFHKPLGLLRIGRWLEDAGYQVCLVDALDVRDEASRAALGAPRRRDNGTGKFFQQLARFPGGRVVKRRYSRYGILAESFAQRIARSKPDIVLVTSGMTYWYPGVVETVRTAREQHPCAPIVVGGVYAALLPDHCEKTAEPDYVVATANWNELKRIVKLHRLPVPPGEPDGRVLLREDVWRGAGVLRLNNGCPLGCDYCASHLLYPGFSAGNAGECFRVLAELAGSCHLASFAFYDDALLHCKEKCFVPFLENVVGAGLKVSFYMPNAVHLGLLDLRTAKLMHEAGFEEVRLGYESSSEAFHDCHDGKVEPGDFEESARLLLEAGFSGSEIIAYILAGLPGQRWQEVEESIRRVTSAGIRASIAEYSPVPGTALWEKSVKASDYPIAEEPLFQNNSMMPLSWNGFTREDLQRMKDLSRQLSPAKTAAANR